MGRKLVLEGPAAAAVERLAKAARVSPAELLRRALRREEDAQRDQEAQRGEEAERRMGETLLRRASVLNREDPEVSGRRSGGEAGEGEQWRRVDAGTVLRGDGMLSVRAEAARAKEGRGGDLAGEGAVSGEMPGVDAAEGARLLEAEIAGLAAGLRSLGESLRDVAGEGSERSRAISDRFDLIEDDDEPGPLREPEVREDAERVRVYDMIVQDADHFSFRVGHDLHGSGDAVSGKPISMADLYAEIPEIDLVAGQVVDELNSYVPREAKGALWQEHISGPFRFRGVFRSEEEYLVTGEAGGDLIRIHLPLGRVSSGGIRSFARAAMLSRYKSVLSGPHPVRDVPPDASEDLPAGEGINPPVEGPENG